MIFPRFLAVLVLTVGYSAACATGGNRAVANVTVEQLPQMILTLEQLGPGYTGFDADEDNGERDNEKTIASGANPDEERALVEKFGRITGYAGSYSSVDMLLRGSGVWSVGTEVELYPTSKNVGAALVAGMERLRKDVSGTSEYGQLQSFKSFDPKLGRDSGGVLFRTLVPGVDLGLKRDVPLQFALVAFGDGPVLGSVLIIRADDKEDQKEVKRLARQLKAQIESVAARPQGDAFPPQPGNPPAD
jgi:hypothetical protein